MLKRHLASSFLIFLCLSLAIDSTYSNQFQDVESPLVLPPLSSPPPVSSSSSTPLTFSRFLARYLDIQKYHYEAMLVLLLMIYILNYYMGKKANEKLAQKWVAENKDIFDQNFSYIGVGDKNIGCLIDQTSPSCYKFYASGRINCTYAMTTLDFKKRHDLLSMLIFGLIWPQKDKITIEIPIDIKSPFPIVFALVKRREAKAFYSEYTDLKSLCSKIPFEKLESAYTVFGENLETVEYVLTQKVIAVLTKYDQIIQSLHITDQKYTNKLYLKIEMNTPKNLEDYKDYRQILTMIFYIVDMIVDHRLSAQAKAKSERDRATIESLKAKEDVEKRNEELQKKKAEEKKKKEEAFKKLPKEQQKKLEEKEQRKESKKKMSQKLVKIG